MDLTAKMQLMEQEIQLLKQQQFTKTQQISQLPDQISEFKQANREKSRSVASRESESQFVMALDSHDGSDMLDSQGVAQTDLLASMGSVYVSNQSSGSRSSDQAASYDNKSRAAGGAPSD